MPSSRYSWVLQRPFYKEADWLAAKPEPKWLSYEAFAVLPSDDGRRGGP